MLLHSTPSILLMALLSNGNMVAVSTTRGAH